MLTTISLIAAVAAIAVALTALLGQRNNARAIKELTEEIESLKEQQLTATTPDTETAIRRFDRRLSALERAAETARGGNAAHDKSTPRDNVNTPTGPRRGYFGDVINSDVPYFTRLLTVPDSEAIFSATVDGDTASFALMSLPMAQSFDFIDSAIEFTGGVSKSAATSMTTLIPGTARHQSGRWVITRKTRVVLR